MSDIKKLLEIMDRMSSAERKPTGPKFPGYWKGTDPASKAKDKMVGGAEESIIKDLHSTAKERVTEWQLQEKYSKFKEQDSKAYTGIDPIVRQRMGMPPATADEIKSYVDKNPPVIKARDGYLTTNTGVGLDPDKPVVPQAVRSGGQTDVIRAAARAAGIDLDKNVDVTDRPPTRSTAASAAQAQQPAASTPAAPSSVQVNPVTEPAPITVRPLDGPTPPVIKPSDSTARPNSGSNLPGMLGGGGSATWATSPLNPANQSKAADAAPAVAPAAVAPAAVRPASTATPYRGNQGAREIQAVNPSITDVNKIKVGQRLKLPDSDEDYVVQRGDTLDKIGKMYRSGEIGGRVISTTQGGEPIPPQTPPAPAARPQPAAPAARPQPTAPAARPQPAAPAAAAQPSAAPAASGSRPPIIPPGGLPRANPPTRFDPPGPDTDTSDRPAPATRSRPAAPTSTATQTSAPATRSVHPEGTTVKAQIRDPNDPSKPLDITIKKGADGKWYDTQGRRLDFNKPGDLEKLEQLPGEQSFLDKAKRVLSGEFPSKVFGNRGQTSQPASSQPAAPAASSPQPAAPRTPSSQRSSTSSTANSSDAMASYATRGGRVYAADFNNPSGLGWDGKGKYTSYKTPEEGVNATRDLVARYLTDQTPFIKGSPTPDQVVSTWVTGGKTPADKIQGGRYLQSVNNELAAAGVKLDAKGRIPYSQAARDAITRAIIRHETAPKHMEKFAPFLNAPKDAKGSVEESNKEDEKIAGRYDPDDFDIMVKRLGQRAREQDRKHGPVDIAALAKRLRAIEKREQTKEQEDPAINTQDPDIQKTSQTSPQQDPAAVRQQQLDQTVDMATAKGTMTGLKNVLGPKVDTNALASAVTKISDGKPLSGPESMSMSALTPLISKAAETPQTAMALKTALSNAGMLAKQGK